LVIFFFINHYIFAQFQSTYHFTNTTHVLNYKTDNPIYDLSNRWSYTPEVKVGVQGADVAIFSLGIKYQLMGGNTKDKNLLGAYYLLFPLHTTFLWKINSSALWGFFDTGFEFGKALKVFNGWNQGIHYQFRKEYLGLLIAPGAEYCFLPRYSLTFQFYYSLQINDASNNLFIGKYHHYGFSLGIRYFKSK